MAVKVNTLHRFLWLRGALIRFRNAWLRGFAGIDLGADINLSLSARFRQGRRGSIRVGDRSLISFKTLICSWDSLALRDRPVSIGRHCFIGGGAMILPGVEIGDECVVGAGAVVFDSAPARSIVVGNPARVLRSGISVGEFGRLAGADETAHRLWHGID